MTTFEDARAGLHTALLALTDFIRVDRVLGGQIPEGRREFFGDAAPRAPDGAAAGAQRFLEWFALERRADGTGGPPVVAFLAAGCPGLDPALRPFVAALAESNAGVFVIRDADGDGVDVDDALTGDSPRVWLPESERSSSVGNTLVGRLVRVPGEERWLATDSTEVFPGTALFDAYAEEARRRRLETGEETPEVSQLELERVLQAGAEAGEPPEAVERELRVLLAETAGQAALPRADEISYALSVTERPGAVIGPFLDELAFYTGVDLDQAQRLCLRLWNAHQLATAEPNAAGAPAAARDDRAATPAQPSRPEQLGRAVLRELEDGLARGDDLEGLFDRLERMVSDREAAPGAAEEAAEELRWHTEDEGELEPLLAEYLWEREREHRSVPADQSQRLRDLVRAVSATGVRQVEAVRSEHVAAAIVQRWAQGDLDGCIASVRALCDWSDWLLAVQELELGFDASSFVAELREERERQEALTSDMPVDATLQPSIAPWRVSGRSDGDEVSDWVLVHGERERTLPGRLNLRAGDLLLAAAGGGVLAPGFRIVPSCLAGALSEGQETAPER